MAFFDEIGKKITQTGQSAVLKTRAFSDVARMNALVSEEEKKINNAYFQIGKAYVGLHPNDYEDDFASLIGTISTSEQKIRALKKQIQEIKGVTRCEKCGAEVDMSVAFCSACGAPMPRTAFTADNDGKIVCAGCGAYVPKGMRFCTKCGKPMADVSAPAQTAPPVQPVFAQPAFAQPQPVFAQPAREPAEPADFRMNMPEENASATRVCPTCGTVLGSDVGFCTECGTKL